MSRIKSKGFHLAFFSESICIDCVYFVMVFNENVPNSIMDRVNVKQQKQMEKKSLALFINRNIKMNRCS